ncbi:MAG: SufD family Fe-S cluster assembly protein [Eubacteriales bacterium]|nr:SufD family Fe-S cluster assembly protein [Eubacteriales bacterium]
MATIDTIQQNLLKEVAELDSLPVGAYNIRANGQSAARNTTANIDIVTKEDKPGIDIIIKPGTKNESVHIPVVLTMAGLKENVYNDFFIGEDCDIVIVAGCGIHCGGQEDSQHDGIHSFHIGKNSKVRYIEKHYGEGEGRGKRLMNPTTKVHLEEGAYMEMEATQISGIDDTLRKTEAVLEAGASLVVHEKVMTTGDQNAVSDFTADLNGEGSSCNIVSRTVAKDNSTQHFSSVLNGNAACAGHTECDSIIMDNARVAASPQLTASVVDASLIHEAAIGKIAGEQLIKLMTLGLTEQEAEEQIVNGFLA